MSVDPTSLAELFPEQVLLVDEVAERLRISTRTVTRAIEAGRLASDAPLVPDGAGDARDLDDYKNWRRRRFGPAVRDLGLGIRRPYDLRHTCASLLIAAQRNILEIATQLGHRPEMTLRTPGHLIDEYRGQPPIDIEGRIRAAREA